MNPESNLPASDPTSVSLPQFVGYFLRLGTVGFGGPIALAGHMRQDLVDERGWIRKEDYLEGLALAQLAPGPLAAQLRNLSRLHSGRGARGYSRGCCIRLAIVP